MLIKTAESITSQRLGSCNFWPIINSVVNKGKSAIPSLFNGPSKMLHVTKDKVNLFFGYFQVTLISISSLEVIWSCLIFLKSQVWKEGHNQP